MSRAKSQVLSIDPQKRVITVQSGISWAQIQEEVNPHQLAVKVMQSSNIFSIGGHEWWLWVKPRRDWSGK